MILGDQEEKKTIILERFISVEGNLLCFGFALLFLVIG